MQEFPKDIYTEPEPDVDTLANLGPLTAMAGIWTGSRGLDVNPKPDGPEKQAFIERIELQPIDAQTNGPQLFYGLRYHTQIVKPNDVGTSDGDLDSDAFDTARTNGDGYGPRYCRRKNLSPPSRPWFRNERDRVQLVPGVRLQDGELHHHGFDPSRRNLVLRARHRFDHPGSSRTVSPHRSQHAPEGGRAHAQSKGAGASRQARGRSTLAH